MKTKSETAAEKFLEGYNCAQAVIYPFCGDLQIDENIALKMACGFGGGMGKKQEVCGAVTGGIIVIGLKYGRGKNDEIASTELTYANTRELMEKFSEKHGSFVCLKLLNGCEIATEEGWKYFVENDLKTRICLEYVQSVVEILETII